MAGSGSSGRAAAVALCTQCIVVVIALALLCIRNGAAVPGTPHVTHVAIDGTFAWYEEGPEGDPPAKYASNVLSDCSAQPHASNRQVRGVDQLPPSAFWQVLMDPEVEAFGPVPAEGPVIGQLWQALAPDPSCRLTVSDPGLVVESGNFQCVSCWIRVIPAITIEYDGDVIVIAQRLALQGSFSVDSKVSAFKVGSAVGQLRGHPTFVPEFGVEFAGSATGSGSITMDAEVVIVSRCSQDCTHTVASTIDVEVAALDTATTVEVKLTVNLDMGQLPSLRSVLRWAGRSVQDTCPAGALRLQLATQVGVERRGLPTTMSSTSQGPCRVQASTDVQRTSLTTSSSPVMPSRDACPVACISLVQPIPDCGYPSGIGVCPLTPLLDAAELVAKAARLLMRGGPACRVHMMKAVCDAVLPQCVDGKDSAFTVSAPTIPALQFCGVGEDAAIGLKAKFVPTIAAAASPSSRPAGQCGALPLDGKRLCAGLREEEAEVYLFGDTNIAVKQFAQAMLQPAASAACGPALLALACAMSYPRCNKTSGELQMAGMCVSTCVSSLSTCLKDDQAQRACLLLPGIATGDGHGCGYPQLRVDAFVNKQPLVSGPVGPTLLEVLGTELQQWRANHPTILCAAVAILVLFFGSVLVVLTLCGHVHQVTSAGVQAATPPVKDVASDFASSIVLPPSSAAALASDCSADSTGLACAKGEQIPAAGAATRMEPESVSDSTAEAATFHRVDAFVADAKDPIDNLVDPSVQQGADAVADLSPADEEQDEVISRSSGSYCQLQPGGVDLYSTEAGKHDDPVVPQLLIAPPEESKCEVEAASSTVSMLHVEQGSAGSTAVVHCEAVMPHDVNDTLFAFRVVTAQTGDYVAVNADEIALGMPDNPGVAAEQPE